MKPRSLRLRLFLAGALAIFFALLLAGVGLVLLFEHHVERTMYDDLDAYVRQIAGGLADDPATGHWRLTQFSSDPRFDAPLSGFYWQVSDDRLRNVQRSQSLQGMTLDAPGRCDDEGKTHYSRIDGPANQILIAGELCVSRQGQGGAELVRVIAGMDRAAVTKARNAFLAEVIASLILLALFFALAMWIQVGLGLAPLTTLGAEVANIARGKRRRLSLHGPLEIQPLVDEVNGLLDERDKDIERARNRAADLAHGLKTPLTALSADARLLRNKGETEIAESLERIGDAMHRHVARELARARARRIRSDGERAETDVAEVVEALTRTLARTGTEAVFETHIEKDLRIAMDRIDLMEVLGNLLENASRYAAARVRVSAQREGELLHFIIEDDGPGLPEGGEALIRQRGGRLDESGAAGLGLAIVQEVLDAHGATMQLSRSGLGGLRASIMIFEPGDKGAAR
jgi:signal transduction histidine kinase